MTRRRHDAAAPIEGATVTINGALEIGGEFDTDVNGDGSATSVDAQLAILAALE